jgi:anionic cell wall polymer biosynthesis LytR-Cps2A-Psr (LCP) family protein
LKRKKKFDKSIFLLLLIIILIAGAAVFFILKFRTDEITETIQEKSPITVAFIVADGDECMFTEVFFYHPGTTKGAVLDVPGNTGMIIDSLKKIDRIDILFDRQKPDAYIEKIEELISTDIRNYIQIDLANLLSLVDLLEGLELFIANPVEEVAENRITLLPSGSIRLDGSKIQTFLTYAEENTDEEFERTNRYQKFIQAFFKRIGEQADEITRSDVFPYVSKFVETDLDRRALTAFLLEMKKLNVERLVFQRVLGVERAVDSNLLLFPHYDGKLLKETVKQTLDSIANAEAAGAEELTITIEILNGTNRRGLAARTAQLFKSFGYEIGRVGNADSFDYEKTVIIDRSGNVNKAQKAANLVRCSRIETTARPDLDDDSKYESLPEPEEGVDVTILLGNDFDGRYCKE